MGDATPIRVLIADDHELMRLELRTELEYAGGFEVTAEAADGLAAVEAALRDHPDVCLLDVYMPRCDGIAAAAEIADRLPQTKVVMLTSSSDDAQALAAARAGAVAYLMKDVDAHRLADVLRDVLDGGFRFPRTPMARLVAQLRERDEGGDDEERSALRDRILGLLEEGVPAREMSARLALPPAVVEQQLAALASELRALPER